MAKPSLWGVIIPLSLAMCTVAGCENGADVRHRPKSVPEGSAIDLAGLTSFSNPRSVCGELVYVPVYSSALHQAGNREFLLTATLSIHNVDLTRSIEISAVSYFNTEGRLVSEYLSERLVLEPLSTQHFVVPDRDRSGGTGANFLVKWESPSEVARPVIEALMISTDSSQGISFTTEGTRIQELR